MLAVRLVALGVVTLKTTEPSGGSTSKKLTTCQSFGPGVKYCTDVGPAGDHTIELKFAYKPAACDSAVQEDSHLLMQYAALASTTPQVAGSWRQFVAVEDFTNTKAFKMGGEQVVTGLKMAMDGMCEGTRATVVISPGLGFDHPSGKPPRPPSVPRGATLRYELEVIALLQLDKQGLPYPPCLFSLIDRDRSSYLDRAELEHHFARIKRALPANAMADDSDGDGRISWVEFSGPKRPLPQPAEPPSAAETPTVRQIVTPTGATVGSSGSA